jgi:hypothetical protein
MRVFVVLALLSSTAILTGCSSIPPQQRNAINTDIKWLDLPSTGQVICQHTYQPGLFSDEPYHYRAGIIGVSTYDIVIGRLESNGFVVDKVDSEPGNTWLSGPKKVEASVTRVSHANYAYVDFDNDYKCKVPAEGMTEVSVGR